LESELRISAEALPCSVSAAALEADVPLSCHKSHNEAPPKTTRKSSIANIHTRSDSDIITPLLRELREKWNKNYNGK
jgi:hypothetical protein